MLESPTGFFVEPSQHWGVARPPRETEDEPMSRLVAWQIERRKRLREMEALLGWIFVRTTTLPRPGKAPLGPGFDRLGKELIWTMWAPRESILIDIFRRRLPHHDELVDREQFAREHNLRYGILEPGQILTVDAIREWLNGSDHA